MLSIRMQRTGRKGHAHFRVVVQDSRFHPTSGRVVASLGSYDPHTKEAKLDNEKTTAYLSKGAQPSDRVARLLQKEGVELPKWVKISADKKRDVRNPEKRRSTTPASQEAPAETTAEQEPVAEEAAPAEEPAEQPAAEEPAPEAEVETESKE